MPGTTRTMISKAQLDARIAEMAAEIRAAYGGEPILCVGILKGSFIFMADLVRALPGDVRCDFLGVSSYRGTESTGVVRLTHDLRTHIGGRHVLIIEDIVDSGLTLAYLKRILLAREPASLRVCTLLDKVERRTVEVDIDFVGFEIPDAFVVGYGLDLDEMYRGLPEIMVFTPQG